MFKKFVQTVIALFVIFGMLATTAPASALAPRRNVKGTIIAVDTKARTMLVDPLKGPNVKVRVPGGALITRQGKSAGFGKLRVGDKVALKYNIRNKQANQISDTPGIYEIHGTVETVDLAANSLTIASEEGGNSVTVFTDANTNIKRNDAPATLADLLVGDKVEAKYDSANMLASKIEAEVEDGEFYGTVAAVDLAANTITLTPELGGSDVTLNVTESTVFMKDDEIISFADILVGDRVEAKYDAVSMVASKIEVEDEDSDGEFYGTVATVDLAANTITITPSFGGAEVVLSVNDSTVFEKDDAPIAFGDILVGDYVEAYYDPATLLASKIEVDSH